MKWEDFLFPVLCPKNSYSSFSAQVKRHLLREAFQPPSPLAVLPLSSHSTLNVASFWHRSACT